MEPLFCLSLLDELVQLRANDASLFGNHLVFFGSNIFDFEPFPQSLFPIQHLTGITQDIT